MYNTFLSRKYLILFSLFSFALILSSCGHKYDPETLKYIAKIDKFRIDKNEYMKSDPESPFNRDTSAHFFPLKYYAVNPAMVFQSKLYFYPKQDTIKIYGTKGEERKVIRAGYLKFNYEDSVRTVNVYKGTTKSGESYYTIWFTDKTTGKETYDVGRYIDFNYNPDTSFVYTLDFNLAYNPYCAYSSLYSCAVPTKADHLDFAVEAGEKKFHIYKQ
jgi:uncharacterized protein